MALGMKRIKKMYLVQTSSLTTMVFKPQKAKSTSVKFKGLGKALYKDHRHLTGCCKQ